MTTEVMRNKREFNARARKLVAERYERVGVYENHQIFRKHICGTFEDLTVQIVKGWKKMHKDITKTLKTEY